MTERKDWTNGEPVLLVRRCLSCGHVFYFPTQACTRCSSEEISAIPAKGPAKVAAVTVLHRRAGGAAPIGIALCDLEEGVRVMTRCSGDIEVGQSVTVGIEDCSEESDVALLLPVAK